MLALGKETDGGSEIISSEQAARQSLLDFLEKEYGSDIEISDNYGWSHKEKSYYYHITKPHGYATVSRNGEVHFQRY